MSGIDLHKVLELLEGAILRVVGPRERIVRAPAPIGSASQPSEITFCNRQGSEAEEMIADTAAGVVICGEGDFVDGLAESGRTLIVVDEPRLSFLRMVAGLFGQPARPAGIHPTAVIDSTAEIHPSAYIGPNCTIEADCVIGEGSAIHGNVYLYAKTRIGRNVTIYAGSTIGADGFGYERNERGEFETFPHLGGVVIEDNVEIGANACIDRGTLSDTIVRAGARIDNLVHIAHNVIVGRHAAVIADAMIGGSTRIGDYAWVAPSACLRDRISVGDSATIGLGAVVVKDVPAGLTVIGAPARNATEYKSLLREMSKLAQAAAAESADR
jgi:UDP-3-O-[3-hydroxymyristoyl] glucosamine N-acyltransferase